MSQASEQIKYAVLSMTYEFRLGGKHLLHLLLVALRVTHGGSLEC